MKKKEIYKLHIISSCVRILIELSFVWSKWINFEYSYSIILICNDSDPFKLENQPRNIYYRICFASDHKSIDT